MRFSGRKMLLYEGREVAKQVLPPETDPQVGKTQLFGFVK